MSEVRGVLREPTRRLNSLPFLKDAAAYWERRSCQRRFRQLKRRRPHPNSPKPRHAPAQYASAYLLLRTKRDVDLERLGDAREPVRAGEEVGRGWSFSRKSANASWRGERDAWAIVKKEKERR